MMKHKPAVAAALGSFDGLHLGHQKVLEQVLHTAYSPMAMLVNNSFSLLTWEDTRLLLAEKGIAPVRLDFEAVRQLSAEAFVEQVLVKEWNAAAVACGYNFHFGKGGHWGTEDLKQLCSRHGIAVLVVPEVQAADGGVISSTRVRQAIGDGDMKLAGALLGRPYRISLPVVQGDQRGRTIGLPTINQKLDGALCVPKFGVYASETLVGGVWYPSITNIGLRPTYRLEIPQGETHIIGYRGDLYGHTITVALKKYLRGERRFDSLEDMKSQIEADIRRAQIEQ